MAANTLQNLIPTLFAQGLQSLRSNCVMPSMVLNDFGDEAKEKGEIIQVPVPSAMAVSDVVPGPTAPDPAGVAPSTASIPLTNWKESAFTLTERELAAVVDGIAPMQLSSAVEALAQSVNASIFALHNGIYGFTGTPGTTPFATDITAATAARRVLGMQKAPLNNRRMVINPDAEASALSLPAFYGALNSGTDQAIKEGQIGRKFGFDWMMDQQVPTHVSGTITTGLAAKAATAQASGLYSVTATTAATTGAAALLAGDIITFAGDSQTYTLTANATQAAAATDVVLSISPAKKVALVGGEAITVKPSHVVNLAFQREAFAFASRPLASASLTKNKDESFQISDPVSGMTMRLSYREEFHRTRLAFDILWGVGLIRPELACRVAG